MSKLIYCKFIDGDGNPKGRNYTYRSDIDVSKGDLVEVNTMNTSGSVIKKKVVVTKPNVRPEEIDGYDDFKNRIVTINGIWKEPDVMEEQ